MAVSNVNVRHGGRVFQAARDLGMPPEKILDFSASINPLGMSDRVEQAATDAIRQSVHYPEIAATSLVDRLADHHELQHTYLMAGNGSTALIYLIPRCFRPKRALIVTPAFGEYARSLELVDCSIDEFPLSAENDFEFSVDKLLATIAADTDIVYVANPGNPTGAGIDKRELQLLADRLPPTILLVVDEAFIDFCPEQSIVTEVGTRENLLVLRSLTKFYAIPGLRTGYLAGPEKLVQQLAGQNEPWALSTPAIAAACASLDDDAYRERSCKLVPQWRQQLVDGIEALNIRVFPSVANYLLMQLPTEGPMAGTVARVLYQQGILVRDCSDFSSLDESYLRVAVRGAEENLRLLNGLKGILL